MFGTFTCLGHFHATVANISLCLSWFYMFCECSQYLVKVPEIIPWLYWTFEAKHIFYKTMTPSGSNMSCWSKGDLEKDVFTLKRQAVWPCQIRLWKLTRQLRVCTDLSGRSDDFWRMESVHANMIQYGHCIICTPIHPYPISHMRMPAASRPMPTSLSRMSLHLASGRTKLTHGMDISTLRIYRHLQVPKVSLWTCGKHDVLGRSIFLAAATGPHSWHRLRTRSNCRFCRSTSCSIPCTRWTPPVV